MIQSNNPTSGHIPKRTERRISRRSLHTRAHCSAVHSSQELEAAQVSIYGWTDKRNVVYACSGILLILKNKGNSDIRYSMEKP